ncbi:MAG: VWA domain-containing protein [Blastocatellia bacterium]|nr:VWA domain-containing protein [Blastocatellia bacterium]
MKLTSSRTARLMLLCLSALVVPQFIIARETVDRTKQVSATAPAEDVITLTVTVTNNRGKHLAGLTEKDFTLLDNKSPREFTFFAQNGVPMNVGILLDLSNSIRGGSDRIANEIFGYIKEGLARFMASNHKDSEYFLLGFMETPVLLMDYTRDRNSLLDKIRSPQSRGYTALYDACYMGIEKSLLGPNSKRVIVLLSDGQDSVSRYYLRDIRRLLKEANILVYAISLSGVKREPMDPLEGFGRDVLEEVAEMSGGVALFPQKREQIKYAFEVVAAELRNQYTLKFKPSKPEKVGKWHSLQVKVTPPADDPEFKRLRVRYRKGYYAGVGLR